MTSRKVANLYSLENGNVLEWKIILESPGFFDIVSVDKSSRKRRVRHDLHAPGSGRRLMYHTSRGDLLCAHDLSARRQIVQAERTVEVAQKKIELIRTIQGDGHETNSA